MKTRYELSTYMPAEEYGLEAFSVCEYDTAGQSVQVDDDLEQREHPEVPLTTEQRIAVARRMGYHVLSHSTNGDAWSAIVVRASAATAKDPLTTAAVMSEHVVTIEHFDHQRGGDFPGNRGETLDMETGFSSGRVFSTAMPTVFATDNGEIEFSDTRVPERVFREWMGQVSTWLDRRSDDQPATGECS